MVSSDFGKLEVRRHLISGADWAIAGAATSVLAPAMALPLRNVRRFMMGLLPLDFWWIGAGQVPRAGPVGAHHSECGAGHARKRYLVRLGAKCLQDYYE